MKIERRGWIGSGTDQDPYRPDFLEDMPEIKDWVLVDNDSSVHIPKREGKEKVRNNNRWKNRVVPNSDTNPDSDDEPGKPGVRKGQRR